MRPTNDGLKTESSENLVFYLQVKKLLMPLKSLEHILDGRKRTLHQEDKKELKSAQS
jgi:hypothetical protein